VETRQRMLEAWNDYSDKFIPKEAPAIQLNEMKKAFYAGAEILLFKMIIAFAPESEPTEADLQIMDDLHTEIKKFNEEQGRMKINFSSKTGRGYQT
jgi:hypothetical protein